MLGIKVERRFIITALALICYSFLALAITIPGQSENQDHKSEVKKNSDSKTNVKGGQLPAPNSEAIKINLNLDEKGKEISPKMFGLFFEDINFAADGGLYAEKVINRSFEFPQPTMGWKTFGKTAIREDGPFSNNPHYIRLSSSGHPVKFSGLENEGFTGIGVEKGETYKFSVWARLAKGKDAYLKIILADKRSDRNNQEIASAYLKIDSPDWQKYSVELMPDTTLAHSVLRIFLNHPDDGVEVDLEHISLFPTDTWMGHENGLRKDLVELLAALQPGFLRFPGGCIVEGADLNTRYQWKNTIGIPENRPVNENRWHYTFTDRFYPEYYQSNGLGFFEYFLLCEEIGAQPIPVLNVGMVCQFQNDSTAHAPLDSLDCYIQDALDLIEFATGDTETKWGKVRADMGHPQPFNLTTIGLGNEQWGREYVSRLEKFIPPIRENYPEIKIIGSSGPDSEGEQYDYLWPEMARLGVDFVDEHYYRPDTWFLSSNSRYDNYPRTGPKVFAGEYACHPVGKKENHFKGALIEGGFMTGLERNADIVQLASYAPLFAHVDAWQWRPDMIWFDNLRSVPSSSYYVQQLFSLNTGDHTLPISFSEGWSLERVQEQGVFISASYDSKDSAIILKIVNTSPESEQFQIDFSGTNIIEGNSKGKEIILSASPEDENTLETPDLVQPKEKEFEFTYPEFSTTLTPYTMAVYRLPYKKS